MDVNEMIKILYSRTINIVLNGVPNEYKEELSASYLEYLNQNYLNFDLMGKKVEDVLPVFIDLEISKWKSLLPETKASELLKDEAFDTLKYISNVGYKYAVNKLHKTELQDSYVISEEDANKNIELLNLYLEKVRECNKQTAMYYVSEGTLDFQFASGITNNMSLRVGNLKR